MNKRLDGRPDGGKSLPVRRSLGAAISPERQRMDEALARLETFERPESRRGRLIVALDLTASREHSLYQARIATADMLDTIKGLGKVAVKLVYFRGDDECRASHWHRDPEILSQTMRRLGCETGATQIERVLRMTLAEEEAVAGLVFVGDHCEEDRDELRALARSLGRRSRPVFVFHECADHDQRSLEAKPVFKGIAEASGGVYVEFKPDSGTVLRELLANVGAFAAAGPDGVRYAALPETAEARQLQKRLLLGPGQEA
jgi:hypothetical protein